MGFTKDDVLCVNNRRGRWKLPFNREFLFPESVVWLAPYDEEATKIAERLGSETNGKICAQAKDLSFAFRRDFSRTRREWRRKRPRETM